MALLVECGAFAVSSGWVAADWDTTTARLEAVQAEVLDWNQQQGVGIEAGRRLKRFVWAD